MVILSTVWALFTYDENDNLIVMRNGGSIMIHDICEYIGKKEDSYVFVGNMRMSELKFGNIIVSSNEEYLPEHRSKEEMENWHNGLQKRFRELLTTIQPDIVYVHGGLDFSTYCIETCIEMSQKYAYVDHLMLSGNAGYYMKNSYAVWEKKVLSIPNIRVIVVGNGMKKKMLQENPYLLPAQVTAIPNGIPMEGDLKKDNKRTNDKSCKLVCVGSLQSRKNQKQLVNSYKMLTEEIRNKLEIYIIGSYSKNDTYKDELLYLIENSYLNNRIKYLGELERKEIVEIYRSVDGLIMPSLSEGLSLVVLEMLYYGKPVIMFCDNETAGDINDPKVAILAKDHSDQALADAIVEWYERDWDEEYIREYSKYYSMERVADDYIEYCKQRIKGL